jgi:hypothetical protein
MVSKPTGRPVGRPKKLIVQTTDKPIGRPRKLLATDVDRYSLAILQAWIDNGAHHGMSERSICDAYASLRFGSPRRTKDNFVLMQCERPFQVLFNTNKTRLKGCYQGKEWHELNTFRPYADDFRRKLRKIRNKDRSDVDRRWLAAMSDAWRICFSGDLSTKTHAEALTAVVGERGYFSRVMQPILYQMFVRKTSPSADLTDPLSTPEFVRLLIPTT